MAKAKSYRNCNIRVSAINETTKGTVIYKYDDIKKLLEDWLKSLDFEYFLIKHDADAEDKNEHFHIVIRFFKNPVPFNNIKSKFPYGLIEKTRNVKRSIQYLIHKNDKSKKQYEWTDIITNCKDMTKYMTNTREQDLEELEYYISQIELGIIREYNQYELIPISIWARGKNVISNAITYYRERIMMDKNRNIRVVFMSGDTGTGKTTFAKKYCETNNKSYCISSSSNDFMQDYKGEDVIIFDDIRDTDIKFTDMLKILDNHTRSTVISRYYNKGFIGDTIILTSYKPLCEWYYNISREAKEQLYRRITEQYQFYRNGIIKIFVYEEEKKKYVYYTSIKNNYKFDKSKKAHIIDDIINMMSDEYEVIYDDSQDIDQGEFIINYEQEEIPFEI